MASPWARPRSVERERPTGAHWAGLLVRSGKGQHGRPHLSKEAEDAAPGTCRRGRETWRRQATGSWSSWAAAIHGVGQGRSTGSEDGDVGCSGRGSKGDPVEEAKASGSSAPSPRISTHRERTKRAAGKRKQGKEKRRGATSLVDDGDVLGGHQKNSSEACAGGVLGAEELGIEGL